MMLVQAIIQALDARNSRMPLIAGHVDDPAEKPHYARQRTESAEQFA
jgi:hypothetical protein